MPWPASLVMYGYYLFIKNFTNFRLKLRDFQFNLNEAWFVWKRQQNVWRGVQLASWMKTEQDIIFFLLIFAVSSRVSYILENCANVV